MSKLDIKNLKVATVDVGKLGVPVFGANAVGLPLHTNGNLGADVLAVPPNEAFPIHVHPGDHLLLCLAGEGTISVDGVSYSVEPGDIYMVPGEIPHAVGAGEAGHTLLSIGSPHKPVQSPERMTFTDWAGQILETPLFHGQ